MDFIRSSKIVAMFRPNFLLKKVQTSVFCEDLLQGDLS